MLFGVTSVFLLIVVLIDFTALLNDASKAITNVKAFFVTFYIILLVLLLVLVLFTMMVAFKLDDIADSARNEKTKSLGASTINSRGAGSTKRSGSNLYESDDTCYKCVGSVPYYSKIKEPTIAKSVNLDKSKLYELDTKGGEVCNGNDPEKAYFSAMPHCPCKKCKITPLHLETGSKTFILMNTQAVFKMNKDAYHVQFRIKGLRNDQKVVYGLSELTAELNGLLQKKYEKNMSEGSLYALEYDVNEAQNVGVCDVSGMTVNKGEMVGVLNGGDWWVHEKYLKNNPGGWLDISIAEDGIVRTPKKCAITNDIARRAKAGEGWSCDEPNKGRRFKNGEIVYQCMYRKGSDTAYATEHVTCAKLVPANDLLKPYRKADEVVVSMGFDGKNFYSSSGGDGKRYGINELNGDNKKGPECFREYAWKRNLIPVVIVYDHSTASESSNIIKIEHHFSKAERVMIH